MELEDKIWSALEEVIDPELGINIVDLGLVYELQVTGQQVNISMTLTIPECPLQDTIVNDIKSKVEAINGVKEVKVHLVWEPAWTPARMNDRAREELRRRQPV